MSFAAEYAGQSARFLHFGVPFGDLIALRDVGDWGTWSIALAARSAAYEREGDDAAGEGHLQSALSLWRTAASLSHFAQIRRQDPEEKAELQSRCRAIFARLAPRLAPPAEPIAVPFSGGTLPGFLRILPGRPIVILINGLDSAKEVELAAFGEGLLARDVSVAAVDFPGLGALNGVVPLALFDQAFECLLGALRENPRISDRIAILGVSFGGHLACRAAALTPHVAAAVSLGGFFDFTPMLRLPPVASANLRRAWLGPGQSEDGEMRSWIDLSNLAARPRCPLLIIHGGRDHLVDREQIERLRSWAPHARIVEYADAEHVCTDRFAECLPVLWDFLADALNGGRA